MATSACDLFILDWILTDMQGNDVLTVLKIRESTKDTSVLMITERDKQSEVEDALRKGADGYLTKPFKFGKIGSEVREMLA
ncbi:MAG: DNA-binding response OmpR family regulator [Polaribacter sp.]|jgi:DNA-binding response OmpR family regulator